MTSANDVDRIERAAPPHARLGQAIETATEITAIILLIITVAVALLQVFCRYVLSDALSWPEEFAKFSFVWFVFIGAAMVSRRGDHIAIDLVPRMLLPRARQWHGLMARVISAAAMTFVLVIGAALAMRSTFVSPALQWSHAFLYLAAPVGAALSLVLYSMTPIDGFSRTWGGLAALLTGVALALLLNAAGTYGLIPTTSAVAGPLMILVIGFMLLGVPIVDALLFGTFVAFIPRGELMQYSVPQSMVNGLDYLLLAIPFFIVAAGLMNAGGITERLVALAASLVGHFRGGLGHVNVLTNLLMGGISGSSTADAAAIAKTMVPAMERRGYPKPFSVALTSAASILANMIPPSLGLIIYASLASVSVGALFVATVVPGLLMALTLSIVVHLTCVYRGFGVPEARTSWALRRNAALVALPALVLPIVIVGGIRYGVFSATEAGAVAALYSLICGTLFYRSVTGAALQMALRNALSETVTVMVVIAASAPFAFALVIEQVPQKIATFLSDYASNWILLLLLLNAFLLFVGLAMEMIASMVILVPLLLPVLKAANVDLIHFGVVIVANLCIGALTPPLAVLIFTAAKVTDTPIELAYKACRPFMLALLIWLAVITFVPALSLAPVKFFG